MVIPRLEELIVPLPCLKHFSQRQYLAGATKAAETDQKHFLQGLKPIDSQALEVGGEAPTPETGCYEAIRRDDEDEPACAAAASASRPS